MATSGAGRTVRKVVILFAVLTALLFAGDYGAAALAEHRVAQQVRDTLGLTSDPIVRINGFPFLAQAAAGDYPDVGVDVDGISYGLLQLSLRAHLSHARVSASAFFGDGAPVIRIDQAEGTVLVDPGDLGDLLGVPDLRVDPVSPAQPVELQAEATASSAPVEPTPMVQLSGTAPGLDEPVAVIASVDVVDGQLQITGRDVQIGSGGALDALLPGPVDEAILQAFTVKIDASGLPFGATPTTVRAEGGALAISGSAQNLTLNG